MIKEVINGDILKSDATFIAHQINCVTTTAKGLSKSIFDKYPNANIYKSSTKRIVGKTYYDFTRNGKVIFHLAGQIRPGKPTIHYPDRYIDRISYFKSCMISLEQEIEYLKQQYNIKKEIVVAFPYGIGCGLAGGKWVDYESILQDSSLNIVLYKL